MLTVHDSEPELAPISPFAEVLRAAAAALNAARAQRALDYDAEAAAESALRVSLMLARRVFDGARPRLEIAFPGRKGLVKSLYWREREGG